MDGLAIAASLTEVRPAVSGGLVRQIYQPERGTFVAHLFAGRDVRLLLSPREAAIHLTKLDFAYPKAPSPFVMQLRKHLRGGKILDVCQHGWERAVSLTVERRGVAGTERLVLLVELLGVRGNLILLEENRVMAAWRADPRAVPGSLYQPLPAQEKLDPAETGPLDLAVLLQEEDPERAMVRVIDGIGRQTARAVLERAKANPRAASPEERLLSALRAVVAAAKNPQPEYDAAGDRASFFGLLPPGESCAGFWAALDREYAARHEETQAESEEAALRAELTRAIKRGERTVSRLREWLVSADSADALGRRADLIMTYHRALSRGTAQTTLADPQTGEPVTITLDPRLSSVENAQALYKRAKRLRRGRPIVERRLARAEQELSILREDLAGLDEGRPRSDGAVTATASASLPGAPSLRTASGVYRIDGYTVEVGKDAAQNDALLRRARPDDLWLHAKGVAGSHVIVRRQGRSQIPRGVLEKAARLAALHSKAKREKRVTVSVTAVKHVRKPKGAPPGLVILAREDTLTVKL